MTEKITVSYKKLSDESFEQSTYNFGRAINEIDKKFGEGYAKLHPELISAFLISSANEYSGLVIAVSIQQLKDDLSEISESISNIALQLETNRTNIL